MTTTPTEDPSQQAASDAVTLLRDEAEIRNVIARIAHASDDGDLERDYLPLFTDDARWSVVETDIDYRGKAEILAAARERRQTGRQGPGTGLLHLNTSLWVAVDGGDEAHAESYFVVSKAATSLVEPGTVAGTGRYRDTFRRTPEGWKLASRSVLLRPT